LLGFFCPRSGDLNRLKETSFEQYAVWCRENRFIMTSKEHYLQQSRMAFDKARAQQDEEERNNAQLEMWRRDRAAECRLRQKLKDLTPSETQCPGCKLWFKGTGMFCPACMAKRKRSPDYIHDERYWTEGIRQIREYGHPGPGP